jgi:hypothetical protein
LIECAASIVGSRAHALRAVARAHDSLSVTQLLPWLIVVSGG